MDGRGGIVLRQWALFYKGIALIDCVGTSAVFLFRFALWKFWIFALMGAGWSWSVQCRYVCSKNFASVRDKEGGNSTRNMLQRWRATRGIKQGLREMVVETQKKNCARIRQLLTTACLADAVVCKYTRTKLITTPMHQWKGFVYEIKTRQHSHDCFQYCLHAKR